MDCKDILHKWCCRNKLGLPDYQVQNGGPNTHCQSRFKCEVRIGSIAYVGVGESRSKKPSRTNAARDFLLHLAREGLMNADDIPLSNKCNSKKAEDKASKSNGGNRGGVRTAKGDVYQSQNDTRRYKEGSSSISTVVGSKRKHPSSTNDVSSSGPSDSKVQRLQVESSKAGPSSVEGSNQRRPPTKRSKRKKSTKSGTYDPYSHLTEAERQVVIQYSATSSKDVVVKDSKSSSHQPLSQQTKCPKSFQISSSTSSETSTEKPRLSMVESRQSPAFKTTNPSSLRSHSTPKFDLISNNSSASEDSVIFVKQTFAQKTPRNDVSTASTSIPDSCRIENQTVIENPPKRTFSKFFTSTPVTSSSIKKVNPFPTLTPISLPSSTSFSNWKCDAPAFTGKDSEPVFQFSHGSKGSECRAPVTNLFSSNLNKAIFNTSTSGSSGLIFSPSSDARSSWPCPTQEVPEHDSLSKTLTSSKNGEKSSNNDDSVIIIDSSTTICVQPNCEPFEVIEILDSDTEDMDVDDDNVIQSLLCVREETINLDAKDAGSLSETITNATIQKVSPPKKLKQLVLVMDTNVLIHSLSFFANLLSVQLPGYGRPIVLLPWMIILELDELKSERPRRNRVDPAVAYRARKATRLLQKLIMDHHPQLVSQKPTEVMEELEIPVHCNDDRILHCCLQWKKRHENDEVVLVTRDRNLSTKALIADLITSSNTDLWTTLKMPTPAIFLDDRPDSSVCALENATKHRKTKAQTLPVSDVCTLQKTNNIVKKQPQTLPVSNVCTLDKTNNSVKKQPQPTNVQQQPQMKLTKAPQSNPQGHLGKASKVQPQPPGPQIHTSGNTGNPQKIAQDVFAKEESQRHVFAKLSSIWDLILSARYQLFGMVDFSLNGLEYNEACWYLNHLQEGINCFANSMDECLSLSPLVIRSKEGLAPFTRLQDLLNTFYISMGTLQVDPIFKVSCDELKCYFEDVDNRLRLSEGLNELREILASIDTFRSTPRTG